MNYLFKNDRSYAGAKLLIYNVHAVVYNRNIYEIVVNV